MAIKNLQPCAAQLCTGVVCVWHKKKNPSTIVHLFWWTSSHSPQSVSGWCRSRLPRAKLWLPLDGEVFLLWLRELFTVAKGLFLDENFHLLSEPNNSSFCRSCFFFFFFYSLCFTGSDLFAGWRSKALTQSAPRIPRNTQKCASYPEERIIPRCMELIWFQIFPWRCLVAYCPHCEDLWMAQEYFSTLISKGGTKKHQ